VESKRSHRKTTAVRCGEEWERALGSRDAQCCRSLAPQHNNAGKETDWKDTAWKNLLHPLENALL